MEGTEHHEDTITRCNSTTSVALDNFEVSSVSHEGSSKIDKLSVGFVRVIQEQLRVKP